MGNIADALRMDAAEVKDREPGMAERMREAADMINRLPKTRDGVPILPGDTVYYRERPGSDDVVACIVTPFETWTESAFGTPDTPRAKTPNGGQWSATMCYSTREAAEADVAASL